MSVLATHKRAKIDKRNMPYENRKNKEEQSLPTFTFCHYSHKLLILLADVTWAPACMPGTALGDGHTKMRTSRLQFSGPEM